MTHVSALRVHMGITVNMLHLQLLDCTTGNTILHMKVHATLKSDDLICFPKVHLPPKDFSPKVMSRVKQREPTRYGRKKAGRYGGPWDGRCK